MPPDGPNLPTLHELIFDEHLQTDVPHMLSFALEGNNQRRIEVPDCYYRDTDECKSKQFYGAWKPNPLFRSAPKEESMIESLMLCPKPHWYNSGSHRVVMLLWHEGERYALAVEEGLGKDCLFIQALTEGGKAKLTQSYAIDILAAAIKITIGATLYNKNYMVKIYGPGENLLQEGCSPSQYMNDH